MKAMNRTITHNDHQPRNMTYDDIHSGNTNVGAYTNNTTHHKKNSSQLHPISEHGQHVGHNSQYDSQMTKFPQPQLRKGKSSRRENKSSSNGSMVLVMSNLMTKRANAGKNTKRMKTIKP